MVGSHCRRCNRYYLPPRKLCPECRRKGEIESYQFKGTGKIVTYTVVYSASADFAYQIPYVLAIVELDEGARLTAQIKCDPDEVYIGMPVRAIFRKIGEESKSGIIYYGTKFAPV